MSTGPVTLKDLADEGRLLWCYCGACCHEVEVPPLSLGLPGNVPVPNVARRLRCSKCGSRKISTRPQLHLEPLEVLRARYRRNGG
ncbi:MAG: hypothetical protein B7Y80_13645 [Hyphomicrobium sp. 32-62-53]|nr:MAG: hypothetical protein B7Z29_12575 [Hyphomicrobium sp. 12-62-95]OYX99069.1 MAG: hypothetical protein B7Y80_13645 [Hyphomicrobium sp. 32-62-53]